MSLTALITGGSSGLGYSMATLLAQQGYNIIILARDSQRIDAACRRLSVHSVSLRGIACDITQEGDLRHAAKIVEQEFGTIDILMLNAGEVTVRLLGEYSNVIDLKKDLEIDLWGTVQSAWFFLPFLAEGSKVLMISSGFGLMGAAGYSVYCAAKAGVINFGEALRRELLHRHIQVYVACPGDMDTPQLHGEIACQPDWMKAKNSPRRVMSPERTAQKILGKCTGRSKFLIITGSDVRLLSCATKLLPRRWRDRLIDGMLPLPG
jgi:short-subunit dehydrogenase